VLCTAGGVCRSNVYCLHRNALEISSHTRKQIDHKPLVPRPRSISTPSKT
jgi:hypothetical protein